MTLFLVAAGLLFFSSIAGVLTRHGSRFWDQVFLCCSMGGGILGLSATAFILSGHGAAVFLLPWSVPGGAFAFKIDGISAVFLVPAFVIIAVCALYGHWYWPTARNPATGAWLRFFYGLLSGAIVLIPAADNAVLFLSFWEIMALASFFLVVTERDKDESREAGFLYLISTHTGTLALFALFALLPAGFSGTMPQTASLDAGSANSTAIFCLAVFGFGLKAGVIPLHFWLPKAHAATPSHVSALMSGVMIKTGIYGLIRISGLFSAIPAWWGWTVLALGVVSAVFGVVYALAQHDIKRLLAFHSVENIGIILIGLGVALLGRGYGVAAMTVLGLAGALLHVINHGLFKALLFLAAGAMVSASGTRELSRCAGFIRIMPMTSFFFLGGAVAICGLPPFNGFVSEWLIFLSLFQTARQNTASLPLALFAIPALAATCSLAALCFTKVFGLCFLGELREAPVHSGEAPRGMLTAMALLLAACLWIGLVPVTTLPLLELAQLSWGADPAVAGMLPVLAPAANISWNALLFLAFLAAVAVAKIRWTDHNKVLRQPTWGCAFAFPNPRARYSPSSYARTMVALFSWALRTGIARDKDGAFFLKKDRLSSHTPDAVLDCMLLPGCRVLAAVAVRLRHAVQNGIIGIYLLYCALCLILLLLFALS